MRAALEADGLEPCAAARAQSLLLSCALRFLCDLGQERLYGCAFEFEAGLVHHQVRADVHDLLDLDQLIGFEGVAG